MGVVSSKTCSSEQEKVRCAGRRGWFRRCFDPSARIRLGASGSPAQALQQITLLSASRDRAEEEATAAKTAVLRLQNDVARERALAACFEQFVRATLFY